MKLVSAPKLKGMSIFRLPDTGQGMPWKDSIFYVLTGTFLFLFGLVIGFGAGYDWGPLCRGL